MYFSFRKTRWSTSSKFFLFVFRFNFTSELVVVGDKFTKKEYKAKMAAMGWKRVKNREREVTMWRHEPSSNTLGCVIFAPAKRERKISFISHFYFFLYFFIHNFFFSSFTDLCPFLRHVCCIYKLHFFCLFWPYLSLFSRSLLIYLLIHFLIFLFYFFLFVLLAGSNINFVSYCTCSLLLIYTYRYVPICIHRINIYSKITSHKSQLRWEINEYFLMALSIS